MDSAPLPPHERTWRHPSEMAATAIEPEPSASRTVAFAGGAIAIALVAAMIITLTPRYSTRATTAITATTVPVPAALRDAGNTAVVAAESIRTNKLVDVAAIPNAIANIPPAALRAGTTPNAGSAVLPDLDDTVTVLTEQFAYAVAWSDVTRLDLVDAVVVDSDGSIVAKILDGRLVVSHDLLVGSVTSLD